MGSAIHAHGVNRQVSAPFIISGCYSTSSGSS